MIDETSKEGDGGPERTGEYAPCGCHVTHNDDVVYCKYCDKHMCVWCFADYGHANGRLCTKKESIADKHARAKDTLEKRSAELNASSFGDYAVKIHHQDGSAMWFENAFVEKFEDWWLVYTEHCGHHIFYVDDMELVKEYKKS